MSFSAEIKTRAMVACGRSCCICHKFCGNNMEVHHIKAHADGGDDTFENAIPLCFDCHAEVRQYDPKHPKGIKFSEEELIQHRDAWYERVKRGEQNNKEKKIEPIKIYHEKNYEKIMLHKVSNGKEIINYLSNAYGMSFDEETETLEEVKLIGDFLQYLKELLDFEDLWDEPSDRLMTTFNLTEYIKELDTTGFWVFMGKENCRLTGGVNMPEIIPKLIVRVVRKGNEEIIKVRR